MYSPPLLPLPSLIANQKQAYETVSGGLQRVRIEAAPAAWPVQLQQRLPRLLAMPSARLLRAAAQLPAPRLPAQPVAQALGLSAAMEVSLRTSAITGDKHVSLST